MVAPCQARVPPPSALTDGGNRASISVLLTRFLTILLLAGAAAGQTPRHYICHRTNQPPILDGSLTGKAWARAPWTENFVDIQGDARPRPRFRTRAKLLWDDRSLYIGAELREPDVWATLTQHDSVIFHDNDFEVFLDPHGHGVEYFEFEINALNTSWDLFLPKPYRAGGHPDNSWEIPGLRSAVKINGTLNRPGDRDRGWTVTLAIPWDEITSRSAVQHPQQGHTWRINFSRVEWRSRPADRPRGEKEDNWVWSPQGEINMHAPEHWGYVQFAGPGR